MKTLRVTFYSPLEELSIKRTNLAIKNILNVLDFADLNPDDRVKIRKIILDELNGFRVDMIDYFSKVDNG